MTLEFLSQQVNRRFSSELEEAVKEFTVRWVNEFSSQSLRKAFLSPPASTCLLSIPLVRQDTPAGPELWGGFIPEPNRSLTFFKARETKYLLNICMASGRYLGRALILTVRVNYYRPPSVWGGELLCHRRRSLIGWGGTKTRPYAMAAVLRHSPCVGWHRKYSSIYHQMGPQILRHSRQMGPPIFHHPLPDRTANTPQRRNWDSN